MVIPYSKAEDIAICHYSFPKV